MKIKVGSKNPVKENAVKQAFSRYFDDVEVEAVNGNSEVSDMPLTDKEAIQGAINRANNIYQEGYDYFVGLEGGAQDSEHGMFLFGWAAVLDKNKNLGLACSGRFLLPENVADKLRKGEELGPLLSELTNIEHINKKQGAVGLVTHDQITRTKFLEKSTILALVKFINKETYDLE